MDDPQLNSGETLAGCGKTRVRLEMLSSVGDLCD
jgi:hypothetical protein